VKGTPAYPAKTAQTDQSGNYREMKRRKHGETKKKKVGTRQFTEGKPTRTI